MAKGWTDAQKVAHSKRTSKRWAEAKTLADKVGMSNKEIRSAWKRLKAEDLLYQDLNVLKESEAKKVRDVVLHKEKDVVHVKLATASIPQMDIEGVQAQKLFGKVGWAIRECGGIPNLEAVLEAYKTLNIKLCNK